MGRQRHDVVSARLREDPALGRQAIEKRRAHYLVAGESESVGSQGVDGNQDHVPGRRRRQAGDHGARPGGPIRGGLHTRFGARVGAGRAAQSHDEHGGRQARRPVRRSDPAPPSDCFGHQRSGQPTIEIGIALIT